MDVAASAWASMADWREHFDVWGCYREAVWAGERWLLRSHLEIVGHGLDPQAARSRPADWVAVMMNPGGSRPLQAPDADGWAPAQPDRTQLQLMRLARALAARGVRARHIRVVNLSDLRAPKSADLFKALGVLGAAGVGEHSLLAASRREEWLAALGPTTTPVLRAWGLAAPLAALGARAIAATAEHPVFGLPGTGAGYRHPLPQRADFQRAWLDDVLRQALALPSGAWRRSSPSGSDLARAADAP